MAHTISRTAVLSICVASLSGRFAAAQQKMEAPTWLSDDGKELFNDVESDDDFLGPNACKTREKLLKEMAGKGDNDALQYRARNIVGIGLCNYKKGQYKSALMRFESAISELNVPSEDIMMQNPGLAPMALMKRAAAFMTKFEVTQAATALRRGREVMDRNLKKTLKQFHKQMIEQGSGAPPIERFYEEFSGYGKSGEFLPQILKQMPMLKQEFAWTELLDASLDDLDTKIAKFDVAQKAKRSRLFSAKKDGSLLYVRGLTMEPLVPSERSQVALDLVSTGVAKAFVKEGTALEKALSLVKRTVKGAGCKEDGGLAKTCAALEKVADVQSNPFGVSRAIVAKAGKVQQLDTCTTNANIGALVAAKAGVSLTVAGAEAPVDMLPGVPVVVDFCQEVSLTAEATTAVLFVQAWHPEFAAVERTTELRARAKAFKLGEDAVKAAVTTVNDNAKKSWEKTGKLWRANSAGLTAIMEGLQSATKAARQAQGPRTPTEEKDLTDKIAKLEL